MAEPFRRTKAAGGRERLAPDAGELELVNRHTLRELAADEVYLFRVTICDNEVDRDGEAFTTETLQQLAALFVGKPALYDHNWSAKNQCARVYAAEVVELGTKTSYGEPYARLEARCYMPRTEDTKDQIELIESGMLREMSVGCAVRRTICSVCGKDYYSGDCTHTISRDYDGDRCFVWLSDAADAFELSFVAVPAQQAAGVHKSASEPSFLAELQELTRAVKDMSAIMLSMDTGKPKTDTCAAAPDSDAAALIKSARALLNKKEGDF